MRCSPKRSTNTPKASNVVPIAHVARTSTRKWKAEVLDLPPLTSENDEECSGGETRTLNLAVNSRLLCH